MTIFILSRCEQGEGGSVQSAHQTLDGAVGAAGGKWLVWTVSIGPRGCGRFWTADACGSDYFKVEEVEVLA